MYNLIRMTTALCLSLVMIFAGLPGAAAAQADTPARPAASNPAEVLSLNLPGTDHIDAAPNIYTRSDTDPDGPIIGTEATNPYVRGDQGAVGIDKRIVEFDESTGTATVELNIAGRSITPPPDATYVTLVLDISNTMGRNSYAGSSPSKNISRLDIAANAPSTSLEHLVLAARRMVDELFADTKANPNNKISIVTYGTSASVLSGWVGASSRNAVKESIRNISMGTYTFAQAGLYEAYGLQKTVPPSVTDAVTGGPVNINKYVVFMSDGIPNRAYTPTKTGATDNDYLIGPFNYSSVYLASSTGDQKCVNAAIYESRKIAGLGTVIHSVYMGDDLGKSDSLQRQTMSGVLANGGVLRVCKTGNALEDIFEDIFGMMNQIAKNCDVHDIIGPHFRLLPATSDIQEFNEENKGGGAVVIDPEAGTVEWNNFTISEGVKTIRYQVQVLDSAPNGRLDTNELAYLTYTSLKPSVAADRMYFPRPAVYNSILAVEKALSGPHAASDAQSFAQEVSGTANTGSAKTALKNGGIKFYSFLSLDPNATRNLSVTEAEASRHIVTSAGEYDFNGFDVISAGGGSTSLSDGGTICHITGLTAGGLAHVRVKNEKTLFVGTVVVTKNVEDLDRVPIQDSHVFTVGLYESDDTHAEPLRTASLSETNPAEFADVPYGKYYVKEIYNPANDGDYIENTNVMAVDVNSSTPVTLSFTDTNKTADKSVAVRKDVFDADGDVSNRGQTFSLVLRRIVGGKTIYTEKYGSQPVNVTAGETYVFDGLPDGLYAVSELGAEDYVTELYADAAHTQPLGPGGVAAGGGNAPQIYIANTMPPATGTSLTVYKQIDGGHYDASDALFTFRLHGVTETGHPYSNVKTLDYGAGQLSVTFRNLPAGSYALEEIGMPEGFEGNPAILEASALIISEADAENQTAFFRYVKNTPKPFGRLTVTKEIVNKTPAKTADDAFKFTLEEEKLENDAFVYNVIGVYELSPDNNYRCVIDGLPPGVYRIAETGSRSGGLEAGLYDTVYVSGGGSFAGHATVKAEYGRDAAVDIINTVKSGDILLYKLEKGSQTPVPGAVFAIDGMGIEAVTDGSGLAVFSGVPYGAYNIIETSAPSGYIANKGFVNDEPIVLEGDTAGPFTVYDEREPGPPPAPPPGPPLSGPPPAGFPGPANPGGRAVNMSPQTAASPTLPGAVTIVDEYGTPLGGLPPEPGGPPEEIGLDESPSPLSAPPAIDSAAADSAAKDSPHTRDREKGGWPLPVLAGSLLALAAAFRLSKQTR